VAREVGTEGKLGGQAALSHELRNPLAPIRNVLEVMRLQKPVDADYEMFYQAPGERTHPQGGLGIGLTLASRLVELHGGTLEVHSAGIGQGTEVTVRLPIIAIPIQRTEIQKRTVRTRSRTTTVRRILIADDNQDSAKTLALWLSLHGHPVHTANDGVEALNAAAQFPPDVVLLDIGMPKLNGYDTARRIRAETWGRDMLLIAQTGWGQEEDLRRSKAAGFDTHLTKPLDYERLLTLLNDWSTGTREATKKIV
jgi:CheY-like chemotaxis protein